ncbi:MAG: hypothetical protein WDZ28_05680 [Simkaniaceae bacterium]
MLTGQLTTLSKILAAAVIDLSPKAQLVNAAYSRKGFFADFSFKDPLIEKQLPAVRARMNELIRGEEIELSEMMAGNLSQYLKENCQIVRAHFAKKHKGDLVPVIKIGPFFDYSLDPIEKNVQNISFQLLKIHTISPLEFRGHMETIVRIEGALSNQKKIQDHLEIGKELFSYEPNGPTAFPEPLTLFWHPKGVRLRDQLIRDWQAWVEEAGFAVVDSESNTLSYRKMFAKPARIAGWDRCDNENFSNGLLNHHRALKDALFSRGGEKECDFLLQFIVKTINILGLKWKAYLLRPIRGKRSNGFAACEKVLRSALDREKIPFEMRFSEKGERHARVEFSVEDPFGFEWTGPYLMIEEQGELYSYELTLLNSLERVIALLLEEQQNPEIH